jgi:branched-chain amino acid transport system substrate-binding protein
VVGYALLRSIAAGITRAGSLDAGKLIEGFRGAVFDTPFGSAAYRAIDHQGTLGTFVGKTALRDGRGVMEDWRYADGAAYLPADAEVRKLRPDVA